MKIRKLQIAIMAASLAVTMSASASLVINYTVDPVATFNVGNPPPNANDTLALTGFSDSLTLLDNTPQIGTINHIVWFVGNSPITGGTPVSFTLSRAISLNTGGSTVIQQGVDTYYDYVNHMSIASGSPMVFTFAAGTVTVTPYGSERDALPGINYLMPDATLSAEFLFTPVPEPTTLVAGALLLLPFGASTLRILRRRMA